MKNLMEICCIQLFCHLMANSYMCKAVDPDEVHKQEWYATTAGTRQGFAFKKMWEILIDMIKGGSAFAIGAGYELPACTNNLILIL